MINEQQKSDNYISLTCGNIQSGAIIHQNNGLNAIFNFFFHFYFNFIPAIPIPPIPAIQHQNAIEKKSNNKKKIPGKNKRTKKCPIFFFVGVIYYRLYRSGWELVAAFSIFRLFFSTPPPLFFLYFSNSLVSTRHFFIPFQLGAFSWREVLPHYHVGNDTNTNRGPPSTLIGKSFFVASTD